MTSLWYLNQTPSLCFVFRTKRLAF
jgi:hypothetical protein